MATSRTDEVVEAVRDYILTLGLVPATTLAQPSVVGATSITVTDPTPLASGWSERALVVWEDGSEEEIPVDTIVGNVVHLDTTGMGYTGLQHSHAAGAAVTVNLYRDDPGWYDPMLAKGYPVIFVMALDEQSRYVATKQYRATVTVHVEYRLLLWRPAGSQIDPAVYTLRQQRRARADLDSISDLLLQNPHLVTENPRAGPHAEGIGDPQSGATVLSKGWQRMDVEDTTPQFMAAMNITIKARRKTMPL